MKADVKSILDEHMNSHIGKGTRYVASILDGGILLREGINAQFPAVPNSASIVQVLEPERAPFFDVIVDLTLSKVSNGCQTNKFIYSLSYTFSGNIKDFTVAVTKNTQCSESVIASGLADEVITLERGCDLDQEADKILKHISLENIRNEKDDLGERLKFKKMGKRRAEQILKVLNLKADSCIFFFTNKIKNNRQIQRLRFSYTVEIDISEKYCYWTAPRLMYISKLTVDASRFPERDNRAFLFQPFFGGILDAHTSEEHGDKFAAEMRQWVVRGQGIGVIFRKEKAG